MDVGCFLRFLDFRFLFQPAYKSKRTASNITIKDGHIRGRDKMQIEMVRIKNINKIQKRFLLGTSKGRRSKRGGRRL
jgi:hypothetical protein